MVAGAGDDSLVIGRTRRVTPCGRCPRSGTLRRSLRAAPRVADPRGPGARRPVGRRLADHPRAKRPESYPIPGLVAEAIMAGHETIERTHLSARSCRWCRRPPISTRSGTEQVHLRHGAGSTVTPAQPTYQSGDDCILRQSIDLAFVGCARARPCTRRCGYGRFRAAFCRKRPGIA